MPYEKPAHLHDPVQRSAEDRADDLVQRAYDLLVGDCLPGADGVICVGCYSKVFRDNWGTHARRCLPLHMMVEEDA